MFISAMMYTDGCLFCQTKALVDGGRGRRPKQGKAKERTAKLPAGDRFSSELNFKESLSASLAAKEAVHQAGNRWSKGPLIGNWQDK